MLGKERKSHLHENNGDFLGTEKRRIFSLFFELRPKEFFNPNPFSLAKDAHSRFSPGKKSLLNEKRGFPDVSLNLVPHVFPLIYSDDVVQCEKPQNCLGDKSAFII